MIPGSPAGLDTSSAMGYNQDSPGFPGAVEERDSFGQSLAAGTTHQGQPFLLIGSPKEDGPNGSSTWSGGSVYYVRPGAVNVITQDTPGVAGAMETGDYFGRSLAVSDRYFVIGASGETINGSRWSSPDAGGDGMVHVFSHTLTSGRPTPIKGFTQNTPGISGAAEWRDYFGTSLSVLPYRATAGGAVGALVAVGQPGNRRRQGASRHGSPVARVSLRESESDRGRHSEHRRGHWQSGRT